MAGRGETLKMFVVQRSFTTVRRGYDPEEVDRHLQRVSRWFTSTEVGEALARERVELAEREEALRAREQEVDRVVAEARVEADATLEGARRRADADVSTARQERERLVR